MARDLPSNTFDSSQEFQSVSSRKTRNNSRAQKERKRNNATHNNKKKQSSFGASSWSKPAQTDDHIQDVMTDEMERFSGEVKTSAIDIVASASTPNEPTDSFADICNRPLSVLMSDYGEQDLNWKDMVVQEAELSPPANQDAKMKKVTTESRLGQHGKAPLHVQFTSFGYHHGAPAELRLGWSHSHPLPAVDCRDDLEPVPQYLAWQNGLSGAVKRAMLFPRNKENPSVRDLADEIASRAAQALIDAVDEGGHGYAFPLTMTVFVGSDAGRHRSVVLCELAATSLRKYLRNNQNNRFTQPCSVGTKHRDLERKSGGAAHLKAAVGRSKQYELESD